MIKLLDNSAMNTTETMDRTGRILGLAAVILSLVIGLSSLGNGFVWDDFSKITSVPPISRINFTSLFSTKYWKDISHEPEGTGYYRPLTALSFAIDNQADKLFFGKEYRPWLYHIQNILLYSLTVLLIFRLFSILTGNLKTGGYASLLFAVHPLHVEPLCFLSARPDILAGFLVVASINVLFEGEKYGFNRGNSSLISTPNDVEDKIGSLRTVFSSLLFFLALMSKESAVILPGFILVLLLSRLPRKSVSFVRTLVVHIVVLFAYLIIREHVLNNPVPLPASFSELKTGILLWGKVNLFYLKSALLPLGLSGDYGFPPESISELIIPGITGFLITISIVIFLFAYRKKYPILFLGGLWFFIGLFPVSNIIPIPQYVADRYAYIASTGFVLSIAYFISKIRTGWKVYGFSTELTLSLTVVIILTIISLSGVPRWKDNLDFWGDVLKKNPSNPRALYNLGLAEKKRADGVTSEADRTELYNDIRMKYEKALVLRPGAWKVRLALAELLWTMGDREGSFNEYMETARLFPDVPEVQYDKGIAFARNGMNHEAAEAFRKALELREDYPLAYLSLGKIAMAENEWEAAEDYLRKSIQYGSDDGYAAFLLGKLYVINLDKPLEAQKFLRIALSKTPPARIKEEIERLMQKACEERNHQDSK